MKKIMLTLVFAFASISLFAQTTIPVVFRVNMGSQIYNGKWNPTTDSVSVRASFQTYAGDTANWAGYKFRLLPQKSGDSIYVLTMNIADSAVGVNFSGQTAGYKFVETIKGNDTWESISSNRTLLLTTTAADTLPIYYFNNDSSHVAPVVAVKNIVKFQVDMSSYLGSNPGQFDPSKDSIVVLGLSNWGGWSVDQSTFSGNRTLQPSFSNPSLYTTILTFYGPVGDSTAWKVKAYPDANFGGGGGYDQNPNQYYHYVSDTVNTNILSPIIPSLIIYSGFTTADQTIIFNVYMGNAVDFYNKMAIDPTKINFVGLKGSVPAIGNWAGSWTVSDTVDAPTYVDTISTLKPMHKVSANVWSITQKFPAGTPAGTLQFKFGCDYPGVDTVNSGSNYLDNENASQVNHSWVLPIQSPSTPTVLNYNFGTVDSVATLTAIKQVDNNLPKSFSLSQNYPNPFNPTTIIKYSVPKAQVVTIKVYNMLGQEVATLLNSQQNPGNYEINFNANRLASGIYFYTLNTASFSSTKKMILLK